jgi:hypothetical protein
MITSIQPITNFSAIMPATAVSPQEEVSLAADFVTTPTSSTIVTLGEAHPWSGSLFDSSGNLITPGTTAQTAESKALANELQAALTSSPPLTGFDNISISLNVSNTTNVTLNAELQALAFRTNFLNTSDLINANLLNAIGAGSNDFTGLLASNVQLSIAGIGTGSGANAASGQLSPNAVAVTPTTTPPTTATTTGAALTPAAATPAVATPAIATPAVATPAVATPAIATPAVATPAIATPAVATPATVTPAVATPAGTSPLTPADVLQQLVSDVTGRALANLIDPGFASTSAGLFVSAAVFRAGNNLPLGTADTAGAPPPAVTAAQPARAV